MLKVHELKILSEYFADVESAILTEIATIRS